MTLEIGITYMQRNTTLELRIIYIYAEKEKYYHDQVQDPFISIMNNPYI